MPAADGVGAPLLGASCCKRTSLGASHFMHLDSCTLAWCPLLGA